jgi:O-antigen/teichoic acid export membrane protein
MNPPENPSKSAPKDPPTERALSPAWRILKNSTALSLAVLLERGIAIVLPWYVARVQGRQDWGIYSTALAFVMIAAPLAYWGLDQLLPREIGRDRKQVGLLLANAGVVGAGVSLLTTVMAAAVVYLLGYPPEVQYLIILGLVLTLLPRTEATLCEAAVNGLERMEWITAVRFPLTLLRVVISVLLLAMGYGLQVLFWLWAVYYVLASGFYLLLFWRRVPGFSLSFEARLMRQLAVRALPFVATIFVGETFKQIDRIFISKWDGTDAVGVYAAGTMLVQTLYLVAAALMNALYPALSRAYLASRRRFSLTISRLFRLLFVAIYPVALSVIALAGPLILLIFGEDYAASVLVLQITALAIVPSYLARLLYRTLLASNNERLAFWVSVANSAVGLGLNILLIPRYGLLGASIVAVIVALTGLAQSLYLLARGVIHFDFTRALLLPGVCAGVSAATYLALLQWNSIAAWLLSMAVFVILVLVTRVVSREDLAMFSTGRLRT